MLACEAGYWCGASSTTTQQNKCAAGTYNSRTGLKQASDCTPCPSGFYCLAGTIDPTLTPCPVGSYCPEGTSVATGVICPTGTFAASTGTKALSECEICTEGYYCPDGTKK